MKTILVPMESESGEAMESAMQAALLLARRHDSHIQGFALRWRINRLPGADMMGGAALERCMRDVKEDAKRTQGFFESFMRAHDVSRAVGAAKSLSFSWLEDEQSDETFVGPCGRTSDVIVMKRPGANTTTLYRRAIEFGLSESGRPIVLSPPKPPRQIGTNALIVFDSSAEQARTTAFAMPLLLKADRVTVLTVIGKTHMPVSSAERLVLYLQQYGILVDVITAKLDARIAGETILTTAESLGCDLLIKGGSAQGRLRQMIFGDATHYVMTHAAIPVLLAN